MMYEDKKVYYQKIIHRLFEWRNTLTLMNDSRAWNDQDQKAFVDIVDIIRNGP